MYVGLKRFRFLTGLLELYEAHTTIISIAVIGPPLPPDYVYSNRDQSDVGCEQRNFLLYIRLLQGTVPLSYG